MYRPGFDTIPPVIKNLLIINIIMFVITWFVGDSFTEMMGLYHWESDKFRPYQLVTHFFMHGGLWHLGMNMYVLWLFGKKLEEVWGAQRFLIFYGITAVGAAVIYLGYVSYSLNAMESAIEAFIANPSPNGFTAFYKSYIPLEIYRVEFKEMVIALKDNFYLEPDNSQNVSDAVYIMKQVYLSNVNTPVVGASGAVYGILMGAFMLFPSTQYRLLFPPITLETRIIVLLLGGMEIWQGFQMNPGDNVAHFAHLGGMLFGFIMIKFWSRNRNQFY